MGLPKEHANFGRTEVVRLRLLQNGLARADDRLGLLDLGLAELHRPLDLSLLAFHREPLRPLEQIAGVAVLSDGDRGPRGLMELLRLLRVCADVPGEGDVIGDKSDRFLDLANSSKPRVLRTPAGLDEALPRRRKLIPVQGVAPSLPGVLGHSNRCAEVRGLTNRVPGEGEQLPHPVRFARMGHLRGSDQVLEERIVHGLALEEDVAGPVEERAGLYGVRVLRVARLQEPLRGEDGVRPGCASELLRRPLRDAGCFLRRGQRGFELSFLEPLASLLEELLDPLVVDVRVTSQHEAGVPIRGVLRFELQEDFGGTRSGGERGYQVRLPLESEQAHPMPLSQLPKLSRSKPFKVVFHSSALRLCQKRFHISERSKRFDQRSPIRIARRIEPVDLGQVMQDRVGQRGKSFAGGRGHPVDLRSNQSSRSR